MALPNWADGIREWARGHKQEAVGIAVLVVFVVYVFILRGGCPEPSRKEASEDNMFGAGAMPEDVTTASAISEMEVQMESLRLRLEEQR